MKTLYSLIVLVDLIESYLIDSLRFFLLKKEQDKSFRVDGQKAISENKQKTQETTLYDKFMETRLTGCCSVEEDLSTTYKQVLSDSLESKYDQRIVTISESIN